MFIIRKLGNYNKVHSTAYFLGCSRISKDLKLGAFSSIGSGAYICPRVEMGNYVMAAQNLSIVGDDHCIDKVGVPYIFSGRPELKGTLIGDDVWIGKNVLIRSGVSVGRGSLIAMGAVVTKDIKPYEIVAGVPAKPIGMRFDQEDALIHDKMLNNLPKLGAYCGDQI